MNDEKTAADYKVQGGSVLHLVLALRGGLVFKEDGQEYAQVTKMLGNGRLEAMCFDGVKRLCHIRGKLRKKVWINQSDIVLIGLRD